jgi:hypothetical protein
MDINDIKGPGGHDPYAGPDQQSLDGVRGNRFTEAKNKLEASEADEAACPALEVVAQFQRTALDDATKLDAMVRASVSELIDSGQNVTRLLSSSEKQSLIEFLSGDPLVRRQVESYLRKALV